MTEIIVENKCRDYGERPGCLGEPDERFTMRFDDIGEPPLYWCAHCGPDSKAINDAFTRALETRGPEFREKVQVALSEAEAEKQSRQS